MKSAGINFGIPESEYRLRVDDTGAATSCYNLNTDTEYIGGGGGDFPTWTVKINFTATDPAQTIAMGFYHAMDGDTSEILNMIPWNEGYYTEVNDEIPTGETVFNILVINSDSAALEFYYAEEEDISATISGSIVYNSEHQSYIITGDCEINIVEE